MNNRTPFLAALLFGVGLLAAAPASAKKIHFDFVDTSETLQLSDTFYLKSRATRPVPFVCMGYNFTYGSYFYKERRDNIPFTTEEHRVNGFVEIQHNQYLKFCQFELDIMYLDVWYPIEVDEPYNSHSAIAIVEDGDSTNVTVQCRYRRSHTNYLHLDCDNAHIPPLEHGQEITVFIEMDETLPN